MRLTIDINDRLAVRKDLEQSNGGHRLGFLYQLLTRPRIIK